MSAPTTADVIAGLRALAAADDAARLAAQLDIAWEDLP